MKTYMGLRDIQQIKWSIDINNVLIVRGISKENLMFSVSYMQDYSCLFVRGTWVILTW